MSVLRTKGGERLEFRRDCMLFVWDGGTLLCMATSSKRKFVMYKVLPAVSARTAAGDKACLLRGRKWPHREPMFVSRAGRAFDWQRQEERKQWCLSAGPFCPSCELGFLLASSDIKVSLISVLRRLLFRHA